MFEEAAEKNHRYQVFGDMSSEKSSENYPMKVLCEECAADYEIVTKEGPTSDPCEDCGAPL
jgi:hypothetical protein